MTKTNRIPARLDADRAATPRARLIQRQQVRDGDTISATNATHYEAEDGSRVALADALEAARSRLAYADDAWPGSPREVRAAQADVDRLEAEVEALRKAALPEPRDGVDDEPGDV
jgi:hypothetical protein